MPPDVPQMLCNLKSACILWKRDKSILNGFHCRFICCRQRIAKRDLYQAIFRPASSSFVTVSASLPIRLPATLYVFVKSAPQFHLKQSVPLAALPACPFTDVVYPSAFSVTVYCAPAGSPVITAFCPCWKEISVPSVALPFLISSPLSPVTV